MVSRHMRLKSNFFEAVFRFGRYPEEEKHAYAESMKMLEKLDLQKYVYEEAGKLPFGIQRKLEVARALCAQPSLLLLDEPVTGLNVEESNDMMDFVIKLRDEFDLTILLIEHTMRVVMSLCPNIVVIDHGETIAHGCAEDVRNDKKVIEAYLGVEDDAQN